MNAARFGLACAATLLFALGFLASTVAAQNLLQNGGFENGLTGWQVTSSSAAAVAYGSTTEVPGVAVATVVGGGGSLLQDVGGDAVVEQTVALSAPAGMNLRARGYLGGSGADDARLLVIFQDGSGNPTLRDLGYVTEVNRNSETVLLIREEILAVPSGTVSVTARIEFRDAAFFAAGSADEILLELTSQATTPPPVPNSVELIVNHDFESGWAPGSPLTLSQKNGWQGTTGSTLVAAYSTTDPAIPTPTIAAIIGGPNNANVLRDGGSGALRQRIDVRGNTFSPMGTELVVSAHLGGHAAFQDDAGVVVTFRDGALVPVGLLPPPVGPTTSGDRNEETVLTRREVAFPVPSNTSFIDVEIVMTDVGTPTAYALADNVSARLRPTQAVAARPMRVNLVKNAGFESGSLPGSPLDLNDPTGWRGTPRMKVFVDVYGSPRPEIPTTPPSGTLGVQLLEDGSPTTSNGGATLSQTIDISGNPVASLRCYAEAWLGGAGTDPDDAALAVIFRGPTGVQTGSEILGPVTPAMRGNTTTLVHRSRDAAVPPGTTEVVVEVRFQNLSCCSGGAGLADGIYFEIYDVVQGGGINSAFPGSADDFELFTGINGIPTSGAGHFVKTTTALDVLNVLVGSPLGGYDFAPVAVAYNVFTTGGTLPAPPPGFPIGFSLDPFTNFFVSEDGLNCTVFGCPVVLPGGTLFQYLIPPGVPGVSVVLQSYAVPTSGGPVPNNGFFAGSNGHEIRIL